MFCVPCLPGFLKGPQYRGRVVKLSQEVPAPVTEETPKKRSTKKRVEESVVEEAVEEPVVEEPIVEEVAEEPVLDEATDTPVEEADGLN